MGKAASRWCGTAAGTTPLVPTSSDACGAIATTLTQDSKLSSGAPQKSRLLEVPLICIDKLECSLLEQLTHGAVLQAGTVKENWRVLPAIALAAQAVGRCDEVRLLFETEESILFPLIAAVAHAPSGQAAKWVRGLREAGFSLLSCFESLMRRVTTFVPSCGPDYKVVPILCHWHDDDARRYKLLVTTLSGVVCGDHIARCIADFVLGACGCVGCRQRDGRSLPGPLTLQAYNRSEISPAEFVRRVLSCDDDHDSEELRST